MEQLHHLGDEASELLSHVFRVGSLQHQQHLLIQRFIQRGCKARVAGQMINSMKALQKENKQKKKTFYHTLQYWDTLLTFR